ncbi:MAG: hypothetical protein ACRYG7_11640 [Janthinobacterium lividum]
MAPYVDGFWEVTTFLEAGQRSRFPPDGCFDITWQWEAQPGTWR